MFLLANIKKIEWKTNLQENKSFYYMNTNEVRKELSRENISSHMKILFSRVKISSKLVIFTRENITVAMVTYKNRAFRCIS